MKKLKDKNLWPKKGDQVVCGKEWGVVLDDDFQEVRWANGDIEVWSGLWGSFVDAGGGLLNTGTFEDDLQRTKKEMRRQRKSGR